MLLSLISLMMEICVFSFSWSGFISFTELLKESTVSFPLLFFYFFFTLILFPFFCLLSVDKDVGELKLWHTAEWHEMVQPLGKTVWHFLKVRHILTIWPSHSTTRYIYPIEMKKYAHTKTCAGKFINICKLPKLETTQTTGE